MMMQEKAHYIGHRQRLRDRFAKTGFEGFSDYESLELLLFYAIPRRDVKPIAKDLIKKFCTLRGVLDAPIDELASVKGVSEGAATFVRAIKECAGLYLRQRLMDEASVISGTGALLDYC